MLLTLSHPGIGELTVNVGAQGLTVGRQGGSTDLEMNWDGRVSRRHAQFWVVDGQVWVQDLGSRNGTWLDTGRLEGAIRLEPGQRVAVGETWFWIAEPSLGAPDAEGAPRSAAPPGAEPVSEATLARTLEAYQPADDEAVRNTTELGALKRPPAVAAPVAELQGDAEVSLRTDRAGLAAVWTGSLSKGALFVPSQRPPIGRHRMTVHLYTPEGSLALGAEVVMVVEPSQAAEPAATPGLGLHLTDLTAEVRAAIHRYVSGQVDRLERPHAPVEAPPGAAAPAVESALARARELLGRVESSDLYAALGVANAASDRELRERIHALKSTFAAAEAQAAPPQRTRLASALRLLERATVTLGDPIRRLEYDFRRGDTRVAERRARAKDGTGATLAELRLAWQRSFPGEVDAAAALAKQATTAKKSRELPLAIETLQAALRLDPFHAELAETLEVWQRMLPPRRSP